MTNRNRQYVQQVIKQLPHVRLSSKVVPVTMPDTLKGQVVEVVVKEAGGETHLFDQVVLAVHTNTTLSLLGDSITKEGHVILSKIKYQVNKCVLHIDVSIIVCQSGSLGTLEREGVSS